MSFEAVLDQQFILPSRNKKLDPHVWTIHFAFSGPLDGYIHKNTPSHNLPLQSVTVEQGLLLGSHYVQYSGTQRLTGLESMHTQRYLCPTVLTSFISMSVQVQSNLEIKSNF